MVSSETQQQVISLGKQLVKELGLEPGIDTLSRWMSHYIAEQITAAEDPGIQGIDKENAKKRCFVTILELWLHHAYYPEQKRPFERFEPIFNALESLDPDGTYPHNRFLRGLEDRSESGADVEQEEVKQWVNVALGIDAVAKVMIEFALRNAIDDAKDQSTEQWLKNAVNLPSDEEVSVILRFSPVDDAIQKDPQKEQERKIREIESRIEKLDAFEGFCAQLREAYREEIGKLRSA